MHSIRVRFAAMAGVLVGVAGASLLAAPAEAVSNGDLIVFTRGGDLWTMSPEGTALTQLTATSEVEDVPSWSADGASVRFVRSTGWGADGPVWEKNLTTGEETLLTPEGVLVDDVDWSPDGRYVTFTRDLPTKGNRTQQDVFVAAADFTTNVRNVSNSPARDANPDFSSTGLIAFDSTREGSNTSVWTVPAFDASASPTRIPESSPKDGGRFPAWSPDGARLVYMEYLSGSAEWGLQMYEVQSGVETVLTASGANEWHAEFSPDGSHIVVSRGELIARRTWHIVKITLGPETSETALTSDEGPAATQPSWRPLPPETQTTPTCVLPPPLC